MTGYLLRRFIQMFLVVLLATMAIYAILNLAPGGPLSGLNMTADRRQRFTEADKARLEAYLGLDKPLVLRYIVWLLGDDWLGSDYMYLGLKPPATGRFYAEPGLAHAKAGYPVWIHGEVTGQSEDGLTTMTATRIQIRPAGKAPEGVITGRMISANKGLLKVDIDNNAIDAWVTVSPATQWEVADLAPRETGAWLPVSWLFGQNGLLGNLAHFHGTGHGVLRMDWGFSWSVARGQPVSKLIVSRLGNTIILMLTSTVLSLLVAIPVGIFSAVKQYSKLDYIVTTFTFFGTAMPVFWFGLMMILLFSIKFREWGIPYLPAGSVYSVRTPPPGSLLAVWKIAPKSFGDLVVHLFMPTMVLSLLYMAGWSRFMRSSMLEVLRQDYVRTARAKGLGERMVIVKHAMRNALIPIVTIVVLQIPGLFGGAIITETIFSWTGMGRLYYDALGGDDWPVVMILLFIDAILVVISTLIGDVLYTIVDPRIRYD